MIDLNEIQTTWQERRDFENRLGDGRNLTAQETQSLIEDADAGERSEAILEGLQLALKSRFGIVLIDATTDDDADGEIRIELIQEEDKTERLDSIGESENERERGRNMTVNRHADLSTTEGRLNLDCWRWLSDQAAASLILMPGQDRKDQLIEALAAFVTKKIEET